MGSVQRKAANDFTATFSNETVQEWRKMVKEWEEDPSCSNPYVSNERGMFFQRCFTTTAYGFSISVKTIRGSTAAD